MARLSEQELAAVERRYAASQELQGWYRTAPHAHLDAVQDIPHLLAGYREALAALERIAAAEPGWCAPIAIDGPPVTPCEACVDLIGASKAALGLPTEGTPEQRSE